MPTPCDQSGPITQDYGNRKACEVASTQIRKMRPSVGQVPAQVHRVRAGMEQPPFLAPRLP